MSVSNFEGQADRSTATSASTRARAGRLVIELARRVSSTPGMEPTRREAEEPQQRTEWDAGLRLIDGPEQLLLGPAVGQGTLVNVTSETRRRVTASWRSAASFWTRRRSVRTSCWSSSVVRSVTSGLTTVPEVVRSHPRAVDAGPQGRWRWSGRRCAERVRAADGRSVAEGEPWASDGSSASGSLALNPDGPKIGPLAADNSRGKVQNAVADSSGPTPCALRTLAMVPRATSWPRLSSTPRIRV